MKQRVNLYTESGEPKRIRCYMQKKQKTIDYITVVFTYASHLGYPNGTVLYLAMNGNPYHPAFGFCQWGEGHRGTFRAGGSRIKFSELPMDCQEIVRREYKELWEDEE